MIPRCLIYPLRLLLLLPLILACEDSSTGPDWPEITNAKDLWRAYPERVRFLLGALDLEQAALNAVRERLMEGDTVGASDALLRHYRQTDRSWVVGTLDALSYQEALPVAGQLLVDSINLHDVPAQIPQTATDGWQWDYTGPKEDDEFGYSLNGHAYLPALFVTWEKDGKAEYADMFDRIIRDWVVHHPLPSKGDSIYQVLDPSLSIDYRDIGEVEWRTLEAGRRLGAAWPQLFYGFQKADDFSPAGRLLMLASIAEQSNYLRQYHKRGHNWTTMEMNGLALAGLAFPEFKAAGDWADYALDIMSQEINRQVYPDGVQTEVSTKTQWVALRRFESVANNFQRAGREIAPAYLQRVEEMYNYLAYAMRPDGHQPLNNDSDREDLRPRVLLAANKFDRPDWQWIAANGKTGTKPETGPTVVFPWAGIHIMRNSWEEDAHWAFFDTGPYGTGHQHRDKLHVSIAAYGKDLLVDGGRYTHQDYFSFDPTIWRGYFRSSFSHNVILVDGKGQNAGPDRAEEPLKPSVDYLHRPQYDYAHGTFTNGYEQVDGKAVHSRSVLYLRDRYWLVLDHVETDRPRQLQVLWHYAPDCEVKLEGQSAVSVNPDKPNLRIVPLGQTVWEPQIVAGQEEPVIQGWYSANYGTKVPNPTLVYTADVPESVTFAWLLAPSRGAVPKFDADLRERDGAVVLTLTEENRNPATIILPSLSSHQATTTASIESIIRIAGY